MIASRSAWDSAFIEEVRTRVPLDSLVACHTTLKRSGSAWRGPCPIHGSGKASTSFSVRGNRFRCFACGEHGDVFGFTMWADHVDFGEAVRRLAHDAGLSVPEGISSAAHDAAADAKRRRELDERRERHEAKEAAERGAAIAEAQAYWHASIPLDRTIAERYLTAARKILKPATGWPAFLRYHPGTRAVIAALTTPDGTVQAVHRTLLTPVGENARSRETGRKLKLARGPQEGACARLAGADPASPILLHGEGLETTLSPWSAAGYEARVYFGNIADRASPERGRVNILLLDDDGSDAFNRIEAKVDQWTADGYCVLLAPAFDDSKGGGRDWNDLLRGSGVDAVRDRLAAVIPPIDPAEPRRQTDTIEEVRHATWAAIEDYFARRGPEHVLLTAGTSVGKTRIAIETFAHLEAERRRQRDAFICDYRMEHQVSQHVAAEMADNAGLPLLRCRYLAETHELVGQTLEFARSLGLTTAHDGGYDQPFDPAKPGAPACGEPELRMLTLKTGASMPTAACGFDLSGPHCPQREGCAHWLRRSLCGTASLVGMVIDRAFDHSLARELSSGYGFTIIDEGLDRVQFTTWEMPLNLLADHHFDRHPVRDDDGQPDDVLTEEARKGYADLRYVLNGVAAGYLPAEARNVDRLLRLIELTEAREVDPNLSPATSLADRASIARQSFRPAVRKICGFLRAWADGPGRISIVRDPSKHDSEQNLAIVRPKRSLHHSFTEGRVLLIDATGNLEHVRQLLPDAVKIAPPAPMAPHQTVVHFQMVPAGKRAMRRPGNKAYHQALAALYAGDGDGLITHLEHEEEVAGIAIIRRGHYFALTGRRDWEKCSTVLAFGLPSLSPAGAASLAAAQTGEAVPVEMPRRVLHPVPMRDGSTEYVLGLGFSDPAIRAAQRSVQDRQAIQGPGGRPRGPNRTADDPVSLIYTGRKPLPGVPVDVLIRSWGAHAPPRFLRAVADGVVLHSGPDRCRLRPDIYPQEWTAADDRRHELGGTLATLKRVLFPPWRNAKGRARRPWCVGRYWVAGRGHRRDGRSFACEIEQLDQVKAELRAKCRALRFEVTHHVLKPDGPDPAEVLRSAPSKNSDCAGLSTSEAEAERMPPWMVWTAAEGSSSTRAPPDG
jgi:hypothetical protein